MEMAHYFEDRENGFLSFFFITLSALGRIYVPASKL